MIEQGRAPFAAEQAKIKRIQGVYRRAFEAYCGMSLADIRVMEEQQDMTIGVISSFSLDQEALDEDEADGPIPIPSKLKAFIKREVLKNVPIVDIYGKFIYFMPDCAILSFAAVSHSPQLTYDPEGEYYLVQEEAGEDPIRIHDTLGIDIDRSQCDVIIFDDGDNFHVETIPISASILNAMVQLFNSVVVRKDCGLEEIPLVQTPSEET